MANRKTAKKKRLQEQKKTLFVGSEEEFDIDKEIDKAIERRLKGVKKYEEN